MTRDATPSGGTARRAHGRNDERSGGVAAPEAAQRCDARDAQRATRIRARRATRRRRERWDFDRSLAAVSRVCFGARARETDANASRTRAELSRNPIEGFSAGLVDDCNVFEWQVTVMGPPETLYEGGFFTCNMSFPKDYPNKPPTVKFVSEMWHPNVYADGRVCISILHSPGNDPNGYEDASERWSPVQTVETIMLSVISMLSDPNDESPANVDAAKEWRDDYPAFKKRVARCVRRSQEE